MGCGGQAQVEGPATARPTFPTTPCSFTSTTGILITIVVSLRVALLNDFEAVGYGIPALQPEDLVVINDVPVQDKVGPVSKSALRGVQSARHILYKATPLTLPYW